MRVSRPTANVDEVAYAVGRDTRIGPKFLKAGIGFGGSCFKKDILNLVYLCDYYGIPEVARYWEQVVTINDFQAARFVRTMLGAMFNTVADKKIAVFGFAFKSDTSDTRESPAITICTRLLNEQARVAIHDPKALENAKKDLAGAPADRIAYCSDPYEAADGAHALVFLTDWKCFRELDFGRIYKSMRHPAFLFDGRNFLDHKSLYALGFHVYPIGRPAMSHFEQKD